MSADARETFSKVVPFTTRHQPPSRGFVPAVHIALLASVTEHAATIQGEVF